MRIIDNWVESLKHIPYTLKHKRFVSKIGWKAYRRLYLFHDLDKVVMYLFLGFLGTEKISKFHRDKAKHHLQNGITKASVREAFVDWDSARFTKPDKPLNARGTLEKWYFDLKEWPKVMEELDDFESRL